MQSTTTAAQPEHKSVRLHYLDWLQVLAILGVFLFHAVHPFDDLFPWHIKNAESSALVNFFVGFFAFWGMPFFFLMAGATSWFSLRRRTPVGSFSISLGLYKLLIRRIKPVRMLFGIKQPGKNGAWHIT